jgi:hypothetical protein
LDYGDRDYGEDYGDRITATGLRRQGLRDYGDRGLRRQITATGYEFPNLSSPQAGDYGDRDYGDYGITGITGLRRQDMNSPI